MISIAHKSVPGISVNRSEPANTMENKELGNYIWQIILSAAKSAENNFLLCGSDLIVSIFQILFLKVLCYVMADSPATDPLLAKANGDNQNAHTPRLKNNPVHDHFDFNSSTNKSTCKICKLQLSGKNPTGLG
jgi:hypothetical protein